MSSKQSFGQTVLHASGYMVLSGYSIVVLSFLGNLVLARILFPDDFGVFALAHSILLLIFFLMGFGLQVSIVQNRDESLNHFIPTAIWLSITLAFILAAAGTLIGILLTNIYKHPVPLFIAILSWSQFFTVISNTYSALLKRSMRFKAFALMRFMATLGSYAVAIAAAGFGAGAWALLIREMTLQMVMMVSMIFITKYALTFAFDWESARSILSFGWKMLLSRVSEVIFGRFDNLMVGSILGSQVLGHYSFAYRLNQLGNQFTTQSIQPVVLSAFSASQDSQSKLQYGFERLLYWSFRAVAPLGALVLLLGQDLVVFVYGSKWTLAGEIFQNMWLFLGLLPIHGAVKQMMIGAGWINAVVLSRIIMLAAFVPALFLAVSAGDIIVVAWTVNLSLLLSTCLLLLFASRKVDIHWSFILRSPIVSSVGALLITVIVRAVLSSSVAFLLSIIILGSSLLVSYCVLLLSLEYATVKSELNMVWSKVTGHNTKLTST